VFGYKLTENARNALLIFAFEERTRDLKDKCHNHILRMSRLFITDPQISERKCWTTDKTTRTANDDNDDNVDGHYLVHVVLFLTSALLCAQQEAIWRRTL
jgi:hypothetical protein